MKNSKKLFLFRNAKHQDVFDEMVNIIADVENGEFEKDVVDRVYEVVYKLIELAGHYGFAGNIWHNFIAFIIAHNENAFSLQCEIGGEPSESLTPVVMQDCKVFFNLINYDLKSIDKELDISAFELLENHAVRKNDTSKVFNERIRDCIYNLALVLEEANDAQDYYDIIKIFYNKYGVGDLGLHKAYRLKDEPDNSDNVLALIDPITNTESISFDDLVGYELQKEKLIKNTEDFLKGKSANNVLLYGDSGTGKSSSVKALLNTYYDEGLRIIEVYKHQFKLLARVIEKIKDRNYKFIIFMDDLSFEEYEIEYKYLKAVIEGGIAVKPDNVLIYATSNRRHLVREKWSDKDEQHEDLHTSDTVQEKLSLSARFGLQIYYGSPLKKEYEQIVLELAKKHGIEMPDNELLTEANKWMVSHGGPSGRTAKQLINHLK